MDIELKNLGVLVPLLLGISGIVTSIFSWFRFFNDLVGSSTKERRERYTFAKDFLSELAMNPQMHPFAIELGYQAIATRKRVKSDEIAYVLSLKNPSQCLDDFFSAGDYLTSLNKLAASPIDFAKRRHKSRLYRKYCKVILACLYFLFTLLAVAPLIAAPFLRILKLEASINQYIVLVLCCFLTFGSAAAMSLRLVIRLRDAERLIANQSKSPFFNNIVADFII